MNFTTDGKHSNASTLSATSFNRHITSDAALYSCVVVYAIVAVLILLGNGLVILSFCWRSTLRTQTNFFIVSLSVADTFVGMISLPWWIYLMFAVHNREPWFRFVHNVWIIFDILGGVCSILHLVALSWDRLCAIVWPLSHRTFSSSRYLLLLSIIWVTSVTVATLSIPGMTEKARVKYNVTVIAVCFFLPLIVICVTQAAIMRSIRQRTRYQNRRFGLRRNVRVAKTIGIMFGLFCLGWSPFFSLSLASYVNPTIGQSVPFWALHAVKFLQYSNSAVNPILYAHKFPHFRRAYSAMLRSCCGLVVGSSPRGASSFSFTHTTTSSLNNSKLGHSADSKKTRPVNQSSRESAAASASFTSSFLLPSSFAAKEAAAKSSCDRTKQGTPVMPRARVLLRSDNTNFSDVSQSNKKTQPKRCLSKVSIEKNQGKEFTATVTHQSDITVDPVENIRAGLDTSCDTSIGTDRIVLHEKTALRHSKPVENLTAVDSCKRTILLRGLDKTENFHCEEVKRLHNRYLNPGEACRVSNSSRRSKSLDYSAGSLIQHECFRAKLTNDEPKLVKSSSL